MKKSYKVSLLVLALLLLLALSACNLFNHTHVYSQSWSANDSTHYKEATCHKGLKIEESNHTFDGGVRVDGVLQYTCTVCNHKTVSPMGKDHAHELIFVQGTPATLSAAGSLSHYACAVCSAIYTDENGQNAIALDEVQLPQLQVTGLQVVSQPNVTTYEIGQSFDVTGMVVQAILSDGSTQTVTDYDVAPATFSQIVDSVTISWQGASAVVQVSVEEIYSVSATKAMEVGATIKVKGYFVGVADEGPSADKEVLIKDVMTDDVVSVRNVPYGSWPNVGYQYGDLVCFDATVGADSGNHTPNKFYLDFASTNGDIEDTVVSQGNNVTYKLQSVVTVANWDQMKQLFAVGAITEGTYVCFEGLYIYRYAGGSDGVEVYNLHLNPQASATADIRTDGKRTVSIRNNVMETNLGANWKNAFFSNEPTGYLTRVEAKVVALYTGANGAYFQLTILDDAWIQPLQQSAFTNQDAVVEVAYAYHRQGTQIQYDQKQDRRNINPSPEEATAQDGLVLDCSSYVNAVYYEAFGVNVLPYTTESKPPKTANYASYAKSNPSNADVVGYWETKDYTTKTAQSNLLNSLRAQLQPGDVLNYRRGETSSTSSGHAMIYVGNDVWLHCTGSDYQYNSDNPSQSVDAASGMEKAIGAILTESSDSMFKPGSTSSKYLFYEGGTSTIQNFCILRPLARGLTPTAKTAARMAAKGLDIEKSVSVGEFNAIYLAQEVTYTITVKNTLSSSLTNVKVTDVLPQGSTFVKASSLTNYGTMVTWTGTVPANTTMTFTYTVKFNSKTASVVESNGATVNGMPINSVVNTVSGYTEAQMQSVANVAKGYASQGKGYSNAVTMVVDVYKTALGRDLGYTKVSTPLNDVLDTTNNTFKTDTAAAQMLVPTLYGGLAIKAGYKTDNSRARIVTATSLAVGDVILASYNNGSSAVAYMYVGDNTLVEINSTEDVCKTVTITTNKYSNVLVTLVSYQKYVVLRPSMTA